MPCLNKTRGIQHVIYIDDHCGKLPESSSNGLTAGGLFIRQILWWNLAYELYLCKFILIKLSNARFFLWNIAFFYGESETVRDGTRAESIMGNPRNYFMSPKGLWEGHCSSCHSTSGRLGRSVEVWRMNVLGPWNRVSLAQVQVGHGENNWRRSSGKRFT